MTELNTDPLTTPSGLQWSVGPGANWTASAGENVIGRITVGALFRVYGADGALRGEHRSLDCCKAQVEAWYRWHGGAEPVDPESTSSD